MTRTPQEYQKRWQRVAQEGNLSKIVEDEDLTNESCVVFESGGSSPMDEGMLPFPDFGDAIGYYRYYRLPLELELSEQQEQNQQPTNDELHTRLIAVRQALDSLLKEFVLHGYRTEMSKQQQEIINHSSLGLRLCEIYILPGDLNALLHSVGNPLADYDAYESNEEAEANAPAFDLNNSEHRAALKESIFMVGR